MKKVSIACDHGGLDLKNAIIKHYKNVYEFIDCGTYSYDSCDYPDYAIKAAELVGNKEVACEVTVKPIGTEEVSLNAISLENVNGSSVDLTGMDNVLYWEHYQEDFYGKSGIASKAGTQDLIISNNVASGHNFGDYKVKFNWHGAANLNKWINNTMGKWLPEDIKMTIKVNPSVKQIQIYTGAWRATGIATLSYNNVVLAESLSWTAEESGIARLVTFDVNVSEASTVIIKISPSAMGDAGNVSMVAVALLGNAVKTPTTSLVMTKTEMTGCNNNIINLTEKGNNDWYYLNYEGAYNDRKKDGSDAIVESSLKVEGNNKGWDYKASFIWTDGENYSTNPTDNDGPANGSNNFYYGAFVNISVNVNANTSNVLLYVSGWSSTYHIQVVDSNGNTIYHELVANEIGGQTVAYELDFAIDAQADDCLTFILYRSGGANCGLAAVAVSNK